MDVVESMGSDVEVVDSNAGVAVDVEVSARAKTGLRSWPPPPADTATNVATMVPVATPSNSQTKALGRGEEGDGGIPGPCGRGDWSALNGHPLKPSAENRLVGARPPRRR